MSSGNFNKQTKWSKEKENLPVWNGFKNNYHFFFVLWFTVVRTLEGMDGDKEKAIKSGDNCNSLWSLVVHFGRQATHLSLFSLFDSFDVLMVLLLAERQTRRGFRGGTGSHRRRRPQDDRRQAVTIGRLRGHHHLPCKRTRLQWKRRVHI